MVDMEMVVEHPAEQIQVGRTPLIEIKDISPGLSARVRLWAKLEWANPGGSVKDRPALAIVQEALRKGLLSPGKTLLDSTSGNTGIAYAWIAQRLKLKLKLVVPKSINPQRRAILESYGVELAFTDPLEGSDGALREARRLAESRPELYFYADQYSNVANWRAHYETTAPEIFEKTRGNVTHFVAGVGTSGTFMGTGRRLRELKPGIKLLSVEPDSPFHGLEGLKHMASSIVPSIYDRALADERSSVSTDEAFKAAHVWARETGFLVGPSGGANLAASLRLAERLALEPESASIVTIFPDSGERYLGEDFWNLKTP